jgi:hypothetical protein
MYKEALFSYLLFFLSILIFFISGSIISSLFSKKKANSAFHKLLIGVLFWVVSVAIWKTQLQTIFLIALIPLLFIAYIKKWNYTPINLKQNLNALLEILIISVPVYLISCSTFFQNESFIYQNQHPDFLWYAKFAEGIFHSGNENYFGDCNLLFPIKFNGQNPYHYFELWLNSLIANWFSISNLKCLLLITFPTLQLICVLGISELISTLSGKKVSIFTRIPLSLLFLYVSPFYFSFYENFELLNYNPGICNTSPLGFGKKYAPVFLFLLSSLLLYINKRKKEALIVITFLPILSIGVLPGISFGFFTYFIFQFYLTKQRKELKNAFFSIIPSISILVYYQINTLQVTDTVIQNENFIAIISKNGLDINLIKTFVFRLIFPFIRVIFFSLPYLVLIFTLFKVNKIKFTNLDFKLVMITLLILSGGTIGATIAYDLPDSGQLLYNVLPALNLLIIYFLIKSISKHNYLPTIIIMLFIGLINYYNNSTYLAKQNQTHESLSRNFSSIFKNNILSEIDKTENPKIGYFYEKNISFPIDYELGKSPIVFTKYSKKNPLTVCLNDPSKKDKSYYNSMWPFYIFWEKDKTSYASSINRFVEEFNITHLLIPKDTMVLQNQDKLELKFSDHKYQFFEIKK